MRPIDADREIRELIDADREIRELETMVVEGETFITAVEFAKSILLNAPTMDAEPVRHGMWLPCDKKGYILTEVELRDGRRWYGYKCSECNNIYHGNALTNYCPNCGAKMDKERKEE